MPQELPQLIMENTDNYVDIMNNRIYFYADVETQNVLDLNKYLRELSVKMLHQQNLLSMDFPPSIYLHLNSHGGLFIEGLSAMDEIEIIKEKVPVITVVDGVCASAATFLSIVGTHRCMKRHSFMLVHQLNSAYWGKYEDFKSEVKKLDEYMEIVKNIYKKHTKIPKAELDKILKDDVLWNAETCLKYGLVDEII